MVSKTCNVCDKTYSKPTYEGLSEYFNYRSNKTKRLAYLCKVCKRSYDNKKARRAKLSSAALYKNFIRAETKKIIKSEYNCAVIDCGRKAEIHHFDYRDPKAVLPVCRDHHAAIHHLNRLVDL